MRPVANFTLHAILAACLAALASSSAAAAPKIDNEGHVYLSGQLFGSRMEVHGFSWGPAMAGSGPRSHGDWIADVERPASKGGGRNELGMDDSAGKDEMQPGGGRASGDVVMKGSRIGENSGRITGLAVDPAEPAAARSGHSMLGASDKITVGGSQSEGQATGKRQHRPMVARGYYDQAVPAEQGSLTILASGTSCRVGTRYPSLTLADRGKSYVLQDLEVVDCSAAAGPEESITFVYGTVTVR